MRIRSILRLGAPASLLALASQGAAAQSTGVVDYNPTPPPTASWPVFVDIADTVGAPGTDFADIGSGRGQAFVDVVGPDPADPTNPLKVGPPDGLLDLIQANSNSPALPLGALPGQEITPSIGNEQVPCMLLRQMPDGTWSDVAATVSSASPSFSPQYPGGSPWGVSSADYDGDGDSDLYYTCGGFNCSSPNSFFENGGDGTLVNVTQQVGISGVQSSFASAWLDIDLDGDLDLYEANAGVMLSWWFVSADPDPTDRLYRNNGDGTFTEVASQAGTDLKSNSFSLATGDLDLDGDTDLMVSCFKMWNKAFYNNSDGTFSFMAPATNPNWSYTLADLQAIPTVPANPPAEDFGSLAPAITQTLPMELKSSMPIEVRDFNGDTWPDVAIAGWGSQLLDDESKSALGALFAHGEKARLYLNLGDQDGDGIGDGEFREVGDEVGFNHVGGAMGMVAADLNGDGFLDVYIGGGGPDLDSQLEEDYVYINEPTAWPADFQQDPFQPLPQAFYEVGALVGTYANIFMCHGLTVYPRNGRLDVLVGNGGPAIYDAGQANVYYENTGNEDGLGYDLIDVALEPVVSVPGAYGSRVELIRDTHGGAGQVLVGEQSGGMRFGSHNTGPQTFGLGQDGVLFANVHWQSGTRQGQLVWPDPTPDALTFTEPELSFGLDASYPNGGGVDLDLTISTRDGAGHLGQLILAILLPNAGGAGFSPLTIQAVGGPVPVTQGAPISLSSFVDQPVTGLYALAFVDLLTGEVLNAAAVWHEPALEHSAMPLLHDPSGGAAGLGASSASGVAAAPMGEEFREVRERLSVRASAIELAPARVPVRYETLDTRGTGELRLEGGDLLTWDRGHVQLFVQGASPGSLMLGADAPVVTVGLPASCCEVVSPGRANLIRLPAGAGLVVDDVAIER